MTGASGFDIEILVSAGKLTDDLEGHVSERCTEVVVEEAFEDVQRDVGEAGVNVGVDGQDYSVSADDAAGDDVSLLSKKHKNKTRCSLFLFLNVD